MSLVLQNRQWFDVGHGWRIYQGVNAGLWLISGPFFLPMYAVVDDFGNLVAVGI